MLHYYARDFFNETALSAYKNDTHIMVYYIDHLYYKDTSIPQGKLHFINDDLQAHCKYKFDQLKTKESMAHPNDILKEVEMFETAHDETLEKSTDFKMKMACYHWSAIEPAYLVTPTFKKVKEYVSSVSTFQITNFLPLSRKDV